MVCNSRNAPCGTTCGPAARAIAQARARLLPKIGRPSSSSTGLITSSVRRFLQDGRIPSISPSFATARAAAMTLSPAMRATVA